MPASFTMAVPEIPVANVDDAVTYYVNKFGFAHDFGNDDGGIAGVSRGRCRLFLTNTSFRAVRRNIGPVVFWINLSSKSEVDDLFVLWQNSGTNIVSPPEDKAWNLHEFTAADLDGNQVRVFYDFTASTS